MHNTQVKTCDQQASGNQKDTLVELKADEIDQVAGGWFWYGRPVVVNNYYRPIVAGPGFGYGGGYNYGWPGFFYR